MLQLIKPHLQDALKQTNNMLTIYAWKINQLDTAPQLDGLPDVVVTVHWSRFASNGEFTVNSYGTMACQTPSDTDFTAYADLTEAQVCLWLEDGLPVQEIDESLNIQIENLINPPIIVLPLPWGSPEPLLETAPSVQKIEEQLDL